jgi:four helix bundle protein
MELETHLLIAQRLAYLKTNDVELLLSLTAEVGRMLAGLTRKLKTVSSPV